MLPIRSDSRNPNWTKIHNWDQISRLSKAFNYALMRRSPIVLLVGQASFDTFDEYLRQDQSLHLTKVRIFMSKTLGRQPFFYAVSEKESSEIQQLVFFVQHGSFFAYGAPIKAGLYADLV